MIDQQEMTIQEKQEASLEIMLSFRDFCKKNGFTYYLGYGTLLGAVRHKGFIPWDDDVDIWVPRPDYEIILNDFSDPKGRYELFSCFNKKSYLLPYAKICDINTKRIPPNGTTMDDGLGIDLFPLDALPKDLELAETVFRARNEKYLNDVYRRSRILVTKPSSKRGYLQLIAAFYYYYSGWLRKVCKETSTDPYGCVFSRCDNIGNVVIDYNRGFTTFKKKWFDETILLFCGHEFTAPAGFDSVLKVLYNDYMQLPPEEKRYTTHTDKIIRIR